MAETIAEHCNYAAFVFVPNLCNAACQFCYVKPSYVQRAAASPSVLTRASVIAKALSALGFREVRFTGGEPTIYENLDRLVAPFLDHGLRYRILTNGIAVDHHLPFFREKPPERFTISVHDTTHPERIFGVPISSREWAQNRRKLAEIAPVEATIVIQNGGLDEPYADRALSDLASDGVSHIKVIMENSQQGRGDREFERLARALAVKWSHRFTTFRYTDTNQYACRLHEKAFPAFDLGRFRIFACCVQVGDRTLPTGYAEELPETALGVASTVTSVIQASRKINPVKLPCDAGAVFCPLGLSDE